MRPLMAEGPWRGKDDARRRALAYISRQPMAQAITYPASGFPCARVLGYCNLDWWLEFMTPNHTAKVRELAADPRITFLWIATTGQSPLDGILIQLDGFAAVVTGADRASLIARRVAKSGAFQLRQFDRYGVENFVAYRVRPVRLRVHKMPAGRDTYRYTDFAPFNDGGDTSTKEV
ncbi:MAG: pyridoxamine 5'-phosphate oxidase family protein [Dehalococcoidia bacterium]|nr:pyridoxamine 5'-phosphate oxidase family protein [Dehalococcoidia bacterium]